MKIDIEQSDDQQGTTLRRQDYEDATLFVADLGIEIGDATIDAVDGTAIVVTEADKQFEFDLPAGARAPSIHNGVLTIEVAR
jgi:hypothetical protein